MKTITFLFISLCAATCWAQDGIHKVDFKNFTYQPEFCGGEDRNNITVKNGEYAEEKDMDGWVDRLYFSIYGVTYGDLNGDGSDEAVVLSVCNTGGTGNFTEAYIYSMRDGSPVRLVTLEGGDRADGGLRKAEVSKGLLIVESNDPGEYGGACCPEIVVTRSYKLKGRTLEETGKPDHRDLYPAERVAFEKGAFSAKVSFELEPDPGIKRFVVGAKEGQTLTVTSDSDTVRFRLVKGEADVDEEDRQLVAKVSESGDFVFEIRSYGEEPANITLTVSIK